MRNIKLGIIFAGIGAKKIRNSLKPQCSQGLLNVCFPDYMAKFVENCRQTNHGTVALKPWHHHGISQIRSKQTALRMAWSSGSCWESTPYNLPWAPKNHGKIQALGHLETRLFTIKTSKHVDLGCRWCGKSWLWARKKTFSLSIVVVEILIAYNGLSKSSYSL